MQGMKGGHGRPTLCERVEVLTHLAEDKEFTTDGRSMGAYRLGQYIQDQLGAVDIFQEVLYHLFKGGLIGEELLGDAVHLDSALVNFPLGVDVLVIVLAG